MPRLRPRFEPVLLALLAACAVARHAVWGAGRTLPSGSGSPTVTLPGELDGEPGTPRALHPSERLLAATPGVSLERRTYGATEVALVRTAGIREVHPPGVCLRSMGLEVVQQDEVRMERGCVLHLRVQGAKGENAAHLFQTYVDEAGRGSCSYWSQVAVAGLARLGGETRAWSSLQVMDHDPGRARLVLDRLLHAVHRRSER